MAENAEKAPGKLLAEVEKFDKDKLKDVEVKEPGVNTRDMTMAGEFRGHICSRQTFSGLVCYAQSVFVDGCYF